MIFLKFNKKIYNGKAIEKAIRAYQKLAKLTAVNTAAYIQVKGSLKDKALAEEQVKDEFCNYVLAESIRK